MRIARTLTLGLATAAVAVTGFAAAPARADNQALFNLLAGAAAGAIIAGAVNDNQYRSRDGWYPAPRYARWHGDDHHGWGRGGWRHGDDDESEGYWGPRPYSNDWNR